MNQCSSARVDRRNNFWTTQPDACGDSTVCGVECGIPGLAFEASDICGLDCDNTLQDGCTPPELPKTFITTDWVRGLIVNMLMTDGRKPDTECGYAPNGQGGHWSESYITDGIASIGTLLRTVQPVGRISDSMEEVRSYAEATLQRLIARGVASKVFVEATYVSAGTIRLDIEVYGTNNEISKVGLSGARLANGWAWT